MHPTVFRDWVRGKRSPRSRTFYAALRRLGIAEDDYRNLVPEPTRLLCEYPGCGRPIGESTLALWRKRGGPPGRPMHRKCREAALKEDLIPVRCATCPNMAWLPPHRVRRLKWTEARAGVLYRYCGDCSRRQRADVERLFSATLLKHGKGTFNLGQLLEARKATSTCEVCRDLLAVVRDLMARTTKRVVDSVRLAVEIDSEASLLALDKTQPSRGQEARGLIRWYKNQWEAILSSWKKQDPKKLAAHEVHTALIRDLRRRLRERLAKITPTDREGKATWNRPAKKPKLARARIVTARLKPLFGRCSLPGCPYILYRTPLSRPGPGALFHPQCWRFLKTGSDYRRWRGQRIRGIELALPLPDVPSRPGRPALADDPDLLLDAYRWLFATASHRSSQGRLARHAGISQQGVAKRLAAFMEILPGSWSCVFQGKGHRRPNRVRQDLVPLPAYRTDRSEVALRFLEMGMPPADVSILTGLPSLRVDRMAKERSKTA